MCIGRDRPLIGVLIFTVINAVADILFKAAESARGGAPVLQGQWVAKKFFKKKQKMY